MNQIFLGEPVQEIKNWFIETFPSWPAYTTLKFVDGTTQTKEISGVATWQNIGVKSDQWSGNRTLKSCQLGNKVTEISGYAFIACTSLTSISIPNSVTSIGYGALSTCISLPSITIPSSVTSIEACTFGCCYSLTSIDIPNSITSIGEYGTFQYCSSLISVNIGNSVTSIGNYAFEYCHSLTSINIPNSVSSIGNRAFSRCSSLTSIIFEGRTLSSIMSMSNYPWGIEDTSIIVPGITPYTTLKFVDGTTQTKEIYGAATWENIGVKSDQWSSNSTLKSCQLANTVTEISSHAFYYCNSLTSITIPSSVTSIGNQAFNCCESLTSVNIGNSVTSIGEWAFAGCYSLTSINIPNSVTSIGSYAFSRSSSLPSITIPSSVISIGYDPFQGIANANCGDFRSLTSIIFAGRTIEQVQAMAGYPWEIDDVSIISAELS